MTRTVLLLLLAACSSGETTSDEWRGDSVAAEDAGVDSGRDADATFMCPTHHCVDSFVVCQYCLCPGEPCVHWDFATGDVIGAGVCDKNLTCTVACPSSACIQEMTQ